MRQAHHPLLLIELASPRHFGQVQCHRSPGMLINDDDGEGSLAQDLHWPEGKEKWASVVTQTQGLIAA